MKKLALLTFLILRSANLTPTCGGPVGPCCRQRQSAQCYCPSEAPCNPCCQKTVVVMPIILGATSAGTDSTMAQGENSDPIEALMKMMEPTQASNLVNKAGPKAKVVNNNVIVVPQAQGSAGQVPTMANQDPGATTPRLVIIRAMPNNPEQNKEGQPNKKENPS